MYFNFSNPWMIGLLVILVIQNLQRYMYGSGSIMELVLSIPGILVAITFHEFAHAWVADKLGDDTPRSQGRLSLNPLAHLDPFGAILMLFAGFGWGKPVAITPSNFNRKVSIKKGNALVSIAGPAMNFILALVFSIIYGLVYRFAGGFIISTVGKVVMVALQYAIFMNVGLGVFNLIPLPPLDGAKVLMGILPDNAVRWYRSHESILYIIFLVIWITPIASMLISPIIQFIDVKLLQLITTIALS